MERRALLSNPIFSDGLEHKHVIDYSYDSK